MGLHITFCASHIEPMTPIVDQVAYLEFEERRTTGTGYYVAFLNAKTFPRWTSSISHCHKTCRHLWNRRQTSSRSHYSCGAARVPGTGGNHRPAAANSESVVSR